MILDEIIHPKGINTLAIQPPYKNIIIQLSEKGALFKSNIISYYGLNIETEIIKGTQVGPDLYKDELTMRLSFNDEGMDNFLEFEGAPEGIVNNQEDLINILEQLSNITYVPGRRPTNYEDFRNNGGVCGQFAGALRNNLLINKIPSKMVYVMTKNKEVNGKKYFQTVDLESVNNHAIVQAEINQEILWIDPTIWSVHDLKEEKEWLISNSIKDINETSMPCAYKPIGNIKKIVNETEHQLRINEINYTIE